jgi:hypothetical protein
MDNLSINHNHWTSIQAAAAPYIDDIQLAVLGGSHAIGGITKSSDKDVLLIGHRITQPVSLIHYNDGQKYDLILRDRHTLGHDFKEAVENGRGTLLHICNYSQPIYDPHGIYPTLQNAARDAHLNGPAAITTASLHDRLTELTKKVESGVNEPSPTRLIQSFQLAADIGMTALRANQQWIAKGKVLGRFMLQHMPDVKNKIENGVLAFREGDAGPFQDILHQDIPRLHRQHGAIRVPFYTAGKHIDKPADIAEAFTTVRTCPESLPDYLSSTQPLKQDAAKLWLWWKFDNASSAVTPDRMGRPSNEYFFAVGKFVNVVRKLDDCHGPHATNHPTQSEAADTKLAKDITQAEQGDPSELLSWGQQVLTKTIGPTPTNWPARLSPANHRLDHPIF